jgi:hypothetical protein
MQANASPRRHRLLLPSRSSDAAACASDDPYIWQALPSYMAESCRLGPTASPNPPELSSGKAFAEEVMDTTSKEDNS